MNETRRLLVAGAEELGITLDETAIDRFLCYARELLFWNSRMSLVSLRAPSDMAIKHFVDSLTIVPFLAERNGPVLDIGSGAGFPGIPLKIVRDDLSLTLLEASRKKTSFLRHVIRTLSLHDITVINDRTNILMRSGRLRSHFDTVTSRATMHVNDLLPIAEHFLAPGGLLVVMTGRLPSHDSAAATSHSLLFTGCHPLTLPVTNDPRHLLLFRKPS